MQAGMYQWEIPAWRLTPAHSAGLSARLRDNMLGEAPLLLAPEELLTTRDVSGIHGETTGSVHVQIQVLSKGFDAHGVSI